MWNCENAVRRTLGPSVSLWEVSAVGYLAWTVNVRKTCYHRCATLCQGFHVVCHVLNSIDWGLQISIDKEPKTMHSKCQYSTPTSTSASISSIFCIGKIDHLGINSKASTLSKSWAPISSQKEVQLCYNAVHGEFKELWKNFHTLGIVKATHVPYMAIQAQKACCQTFLQQWVVVVQSVVWHFYCTPMYIDRRQPVWSWSLL